MTASFDGTASNTTLSNANLTATHSNTTTGGARSASLKNSGKYYFEITIGSTFNGFDLVGILTAAGTYVDAVTNGTNCASVRQSLGTIRSNDVASGFSLGSLAAADIIGIAVDFTNQNVWFRKAPSGQWNGNGTADPASNVNGASISSYSATTLSPVVGFNSTNGSAVTANFGGSAFSGTVPS